MALTSKRRSGAGPRRLKKAIGPVLENIEARFTRKADGGITGIASKLHDLDAFTLGWQPSDLVIVAGKPGRASSNVAGDVR